MSCRRSDHERLRENRHQLARVTDFAGLQDDADGGWLELRNCRRCGSTITAEGASCARTLVLATLAALAGRQR